MNLGKNIRDLRKQRGWTQEFIANKLGVEPGSVSGWETGTDMPATKNLLKLSELFVVGLDQLCGTKWAATTPAGVINQSLLEEVYSCLPDGLTQEGMKPSPLEFAFLGLEVYQEWFDLLKTGSERKKIVFFAIKKIQERGWKPGSEQILLSKES